MGSKHRNKEIKHSNRGAKGIEICGLSIGIGRLRAWKYGD